MRLVVVVAAIVAITAAMAVPAFAAPSSFQCDVLSPDGEPTYEIHLTTADYLKYYAPYNAPDRVDANGYYYRCFQSNRL
jgi:hypothetical protein